MDRNRDSNKKSKKITSRQVVALGGVILLVLMYLVTLVVAIADTSASGRLFALCMLATLAVPLLIWIYTWIYGKVVEQKKLADPEALKSDDVSADPSDEG